MKKPNEQMQMVLDALGEMGPLPIETLSPEHARQMPLPDRAAVAVYGQHFMKKALAPMPVGVGKIAHTVIPSEAGGILTRIYMPKGEKPKSGWPLVVYFHGGGWVIATLDTYDASCRALCDATDAVIISVHYRQAPEHKWPAAPDDALTAYQWVCTNAAQHGGDPTRIAIAGESAGGNLAAIVCQAARDKGLHMPIHQLLVYPVTDIAGGEKSPSALENAEAKPLNKAMLGWFYNHYLSEDANRSDPRISPLHGKLDHLPPATIILAEIDPLRSEGEAYAQRLQEAGNTVSLHIFKGVTHEFFGLAGLVHEATEAMATAKKNLRKAFKNEAIHETPVQPVLKAS